MGSGGVIVPPPTYYEKVQEQGWLPESSE